VLRERAASEREGERAQIGGAARARQRWPVLQKT